MFDMGIGCFVPVAPDRFLRSLVDIEGFPGSKLLIEREHFLESFSHLKTPVGQKKKANPLEVERIHPVCGQDFKMAHHHHQWQGSHSSVVQTFVLCYSFPARFSPVLIRLLARLALVLRCHQVARCSWVPGCRSR